MSLPAGLTAALEMWGESARRGEEVSYCSRREVATEERRGLPNQDWHIQQTAYRHWWSSHTAGKKKMELVKGQGNQEKQK